MKSNHADSVLFKNYLEEKTKLSESSIYVYVGSVEKFLKGNPDIDDLDEYNNFLIPLIHRKSSTHYYSAIKRFIEFKIEDTKERAKLIDGLIKPTQKDPKKNPVFLNYERRIEVINKLNDEKHQIIALIQDQTGVRAGDILRLKKPDGIFTEKFNNTEIVTRLNIIGKREVRNVVRIHNPLIQEIIWNYITNNFNSEEYYFLKIPNIRKNKREKISERRLYILNYIWYWQDLKNALHSSGIDHKDFSTHDFRRCFAREIWEDSKHDLQVLKDILHHKQADTTLRYLRNSGLNNEKTLYNYQMKDRTQ